MLNSLLLTIFGDPSEKKLKNSFKELEKIKRSLDSTDSVVATVTTEQELGLE